MMQMLCVSLPVYEAGEAPIEGVDADALASGLRSHGHRDAKTFASPQDLPQVIGDMKIGTGDVVVCLGAGSITRWAETLADDVKRLDKR